MKIFYSYRLKKTIMYVKWKMNMLRETLSTSIKFLKMFFLSMVEYTNIISYWAGSLLICSILTSLSFWSWITMSVEMSSITIFLKHKYFQNILIIILRSWLSAVINASTFCMFFKNNFYLLMGLLSGLSMACQRLIKKSKELLSSMKKWLINL